MRLYYLLHFVPDLLTGTKLTIGAIVESDGGGWDWVEAPLLPPEDFLRPNSHALLTLVLQHISSVPEDGLPEHPFPADAASQRPGTWPARMSNLGNHFHVDAPQRTPARAEDPVAWVREHCLPDAREGASQAGLATPR